MSCLIDFTFLNINLTTWMMWILHFENSTFGVIMSGSGRVGRVEKVYPWTSPNCIPTELHWFANSSFISVLARTHTHKTENNSRLCCFTGARKSSKQTFESRRRSRICHWSDDKTDMHTDDDVSVDTWRLLCLRYCMMSAVAQPAACCKQRGPTNRAVRGLSTRSYLLLWDERRHD